MFCIWLFDNKRILYLSVTVPVGGNSFTRTIVEKLNKKEDEAEKLKRDFGFDKKSLDNKISPILESSFQEIIEETKKLIKHYESRVGIEVGEIILAGGSALLPNIDKYFESILGKKVDIRGLPLFNNVIGLALRGRGDVSSGVNLLQQTSSAKERVRKGCQFFKIPFLYLFQASNKKNKTFAILFIIATLFVLGLVTYQYIFKLPV